MKNVFIEAGKRRLTKVLYKNSELQSEIIEKIYDELYQAKNLYNLRIIRAILVSLAGF